MTELQKIARRLKHKEWLVYHMDINAQKITTFNVFNHSSYVKDLEELFRKQAKNMTTEEIDERIKRITMYYFWSKSECEVVICGWPYPTYADVNKKIDIYDQLKLHWSTYLAYVKEV